VQLADSCWPARSGRQHDHAVAAQPVERGRVLCATSGMVQPCPFRAMAVSQQRQKSPLAAHLRHFLRGHGCSRAAGDRLVARNARMEQVRNTHGEVVGLTCATYRGLFSFRLTRQVFGKKDGGNTAALGSGLRALISVVFLFAVVVWM